MEDTKELFESNTVFDDVFRTMLERIPEIMIPSINEDSLPLLEELSDIRSRLERTVGEEKGLIYAELISHIKNQQLPPKPQRVPDVRCGFSYLTYSHAPAVAGDITPSPYILQSSSSPPPSHTANTVPSHLLLPPGQGPRRTPCESRYSEALPPPPAFESQRQGTPRTRHPPQPPVRLNASRLAPWAHPENTQRPPVPGCSPSLP